MRATTWTGMLALVLLGGASGCFVEATESEEEFIAAEQSEIVANEESRDLPGETHADPTPDPWEPGALNLEFRGPSDPGDEREDPTPDPWFPLVGHSKNMPSVPIEQSVEVHNLPQH